MKDWIEGYPRIKVVDSLEELHETPFGGPDEVNGLLYHGPRLKDRFNKAIRYLAQRKKSLDHTEIKKIVEACDAPDIHDALQEMLDRITNVRPKDRHSFQADCLIQSPSVDYFFFLKDCHIHADLAATTHPVRGRVLHHFAGAGAKLYRNEDVRSATQIHYRLNPGATALGALQPGDSIRMAGLGNRKKVLPLAHAAGRPMLMKRCIGRTDFDT